MLFSSSRGDWETPPEIFAEWQKEFGFTTDAAANAENALCAEYYDDALTQKWRGRVFCNPPYGRLVGSFVKQAWYSVYIWESADLVMLLLPARTDTRWFHEFCYRADQRTEIRFLKGRIRFRMKGIAGNPAPFPSMLVIFRR